MHYNWCLKRIETEGEFILPEDKTELTIGRGKNNDLKCLSLYVSRNHCKILMSNGLKMLDLASANGTYINSQKILTEREIPLKVGDVIGIGTPDVSDDKCFVYKLVRVAVEDEKPQIKCEASTPGKASRVDCKEQEMKQSLLNDSYESNQTLCKNATRKRLREASEGNVTSKVPRLEVQSRNSDSEFQNSLSSAIPQPSTHENNSAPQLNVLYKEALSLKQQSSSNLALQSETFQNYNKTVCKEKLSTSQCSNEAERISNAIESVSVNVVLNQNEHTLLANYTAEPPHRKELSNRLQEKSLSSSFIPSNNVTTRDSESSDNNIHSVHGHVNETSVTSSEDKASNRLKKYHDSEISSPTEVKAERGHLISEEIIPNAAVNPVIMHMKIKTDDVLTHSALDNNTFFSGETSHSKNNTVNQSIKTPTNCSEIAVNDIIVISDSEDEILEEGPRKVLNSQENNPEANTLNKSIKVDNFHSDELDPRNINSSEQNELENTTNTKQNLSKKVSPISTTAVAEEKENKMQPTGSSISFQFSEDKKIFKAKPVVILERLDAAVSETSKIKQEESFCNYSLTEENIIEVADDDDDFPCSQMFEEPVVIKSEPLDGEEEEQLEMKPFIRCPVDDDDDDDIIYISDDSDDSDNEWLAKLSQQDTDLVAIAQPAVASKSIPFIIKEEEKEENIFNEETPSVQKKTDEFGKSDALDKKQDTQVVKSTKAYGKLEIIEALPMPPRRAHQRGISANEAQRIYDEQVVQKSTREEVEHKSAKEQHKVDADRKKMKESSSREVRRKHSTEEKMAELPQEKAPSKRKRRTNSAPAPISGSDKKKIADKRKELLKAITQKQTMVEKSDVPSTSSRSTSVKSNAEVRIKITEKNRGAFLTETVTANVTVKSTTGKKKVGKITDIKVEEMQNKRSTSSLHNTSGNKEILNKPSTSGMSLKQINKLPRIPRLADKAAGSTKDKVEDLAYKIEAKCNIADKVTNEIPMEVETKRGNTGTVIKSSLKASGSVSKKKKSVRFREERELVQVFEIPKEQSHTLQPVGQVKDAPPPRKPYNQQQPISSLPVEEFIHTIVSWNVRWLEEKKFIPPNKIPEVFEGPLFPMLSSFMSYSDYHKIVTPLLCLELWAQISKDYEIASQSKSPILVGLDEATHLPPLSPSNKQLMMLRCHAAITKEDLMRNNLPRFGDLVIFELGLESNKEADSKEPCLSQGSGNRNYFTIIFAYVCKVSREAITGTTYFHKELLCNSSRPAAFKLHLTLWTRSRGYQVKLQKPMRMKVVSYIRSDLRLFQALSYLPSSPLCKHILEPAKQDFSLQGVKRKTLAPLIKEELLNESQKQAVLKISHACLMGESKICMIQGPPGTGKSHVIVNIIIQLLYGQDNYLMQRRKNNVPRILLCAPSNAAIDELVLRLLDIRHTIEKTARFKMVRVGNLETMNQKVREISSQELAKKDVKMNLQMRSDIESVEVEINHCKAKLNALEQAKVKNKNKIREIQMKLSQLQRNTPVTTDDKEMRRMERAAELKIINGADIVATTLGSCFNSTMESLFSPDQNGVNPKCAFSCCIIDEATQSQELETLIPLMLGVTTLVLVGDAQQLPATVLSVKAKEYGLNKSLFARIQDCFEDSRSNPVQFLDVQYRMHPEICLWPNRYFYNAKLHTPSNLISQRSCPLVPYCILSLEYTQNNSSMPANSGEAQLIKELTLGILGIVEKIKGPSLSVAIITPYNNQRTMILNLLPIALQGSIEVNTIDSFQGQERDIIIISVGRTTGVGFLADSQRLNVALTRARCSLILCGNFSSLKNDATWKMLLKNAEERKVLKHVPAAVSENRDELMKLVMKH